MKVLIFGATGMVGQGVLRECLADPQVEEVRSVTRSATGVSHPKLREFVHGDFLDFTALEPHLSGLDACFWCLGITSAGRAEAEYRRVTHDYTLAAAAPLARLNPAMTFIFVSGAGTDGTGRSRIMWARVKGQTENDLRALPFRAVYLFRPGAIEALDGIQSRTRLYRLLYPLMRPLLPLLKRLFPGQITSTRQLGRAMLQVARAGAPQATLEARQICAYPG